MPGQILTVPICQRIGTAAQWAAANPVLLKGEVGYESNTGRRKTGNESTPWNELPYDDAALWVKIEELQLAPRRQPIDWYITKDASALTYRLPPTTTAVFDMVTELNQDLRRLRGAFTLNLQAAPPTITFTPAALAPLAAGQTVYMTVWADPTAFENGYVQPGYVQLGYVSKPL
ncbi:hyaluronate lyase N-terminal domain-containing protein [Hymenobacter tenuis]